MIGSMLKGAIAGAAATWVMDLVTTGYLENQSKRSREQEAEGQVDGKSTVENLLELIEERTGMRVPAGQRPRAQQAIHYGLGIGPGMVYAVLRDRVPLLGAANGLFFGLLIWAVADEYLGTALGVAGEWGDYPTQTHLRGLVGHLSLGVAIDTGLDLLGG